jgi:L-rhamnose mutarotase
MKKFTLVSAVVAAVCFSVWSGARPLLAFSPYENYLLSGRQTQVGLLAQAKPGKEAQLATAIESLKHGQPAAALAKVGIGNVAAFKREIDGKEWVLVHFVYQGGKDYLGAAEAFETASPATRALGDLIIPHPRAKTYGRQWLQMEWINYIRGKDTDRPATQVTSMVTTVKAEKEAEYRTLHQTVWPGVVDQMARGNNRDFSIFLAEIGDRLCEFFYVEYVGTDAAKDDAANKADPINQRWWHYTDACQTPLPGAAGIWAPMEPITSQ